MSDSSATVLLDEASVGTDSGSDSCIQSMDSGRSGMDVASDSRTAAQIADERSIPASVRAAYRHYYDLLPSLFEDHAYEWVAVQASGGVQLAASLPELLAKCRRLGLQHGQYITMQIELLEDESLESAG